VIPAPRFNRFAHGFPHIFAGSCVPNTTAKNRPLSSPATPTP
jgi:hypothetical protein